MHASTLVSLRAHAVLIALCVAVSDAAWLVVCGCSGHVHALQSLAVRMATLVCAGAVAVIVRRIAKLAFDATTTPRAANIHGMRGHCWLVQLHLELHPAESRRSAACGCNCAAQSSRNPRGRA